MPAFLLDDYETVSNCNKFLLIFQFFFLFAVFGTSTGEQKIKLEMAADNVLSNWVSMLR